MKGEITTPRGGLGAGRSLPPGDSAQPSDARHVPLPEPQPKAELVVADEEAARADELVVLRDVLARYPYGTVLSFGAPCRCPDCGNYGFPGR